MYRTNIRVKIFWLGIFFIATCNGLDYPEVTREDAVTVYPGINVSDPYRWMEDVEANAGRIKNFVDAQNNLTVPYLEQYELRDQLRERISALWDYPKKGEILKHGNHYFQFANSGLENQNILYIQDSLEEPTNRRVFLDPNELSDDGTMALTSTRAFSKNGEIFAYGLSKSGSDWITIRFKNVATGQDLPDVLTKVKFTDIVWKNDEGIFYGHYPLFEGDPVGSDPGTNKDQKISYHKIGTLQDDDPEVFEMPSNPNRILASGMAISKEGDILLVTPEAADGEGSYGDQSVHGIRISSDNPAEWTVQNIVETYDAKYMYVTNVGSRFYFLTNKNAPRNQISGIDLNDLNAPWTTLVPEDAKNVIDWVAPINGTHLVINYLEDVKSKLELRDLSGNFIKNLPIDMGSIESHSGGLGDSILFIKFVSFLVPNRIYSLDFTKEVESQMELEIYEDVTIPGFNPSDFLTEQKWYTSTDGAQIPMFLVHNKNLVKNKENPVMIYGYGGFNINVLPTFAVQRIIFMQEFQGVIAITNLRGGGEFGIAWHQSGSLKNKQNVFDDFQSAAKYLIDNDYTNTKKVIIEGRSNGGLLVGACVNQRPDLFGVAIASVGVMDMLRYHTFTIGHSWVSEYGSADDPEYFPYIYKYSPLHKIRLPENEDIQYPAVLVTTSDHDDRVVPAHSYKYTAELQYSVGRNSRQTNALLLRVETDAGHGAGKPTSKQIEEQVDIFSFIGQSLKPKSEGGSGGSARLSHFSFGFILLVVTLIMV